MQKVSYLVDKVTKPILQKFGFYHNKIITDWRLIVGDKVATCSTPTKLILKKGKYDGTLFINVTSSSIATELYYQTDLILEKLAFYFGYRAVTKLKIVQTPNYDGTQPIPAKQNPETILANTQKDHLTTMLSEIEDEGLRSALFTLGAYVITRDEDVI